MLISVSVVLS